MEQKWCRLLSAWALRNSVQKPETKEVESAWAATFRVVGGARGVGCVAVWAVDQREQWDKGRLFAVTTHIVGVEVDHLGKFVFLQRHSESPFRNMKVRYWHYLTAYRVNASVK